MKCFGECFKGKYPDEERRLGSKGRDMVAGYGEECKHMI